ncbi:Putative Zinc finger, RanBP2-type [Septoria linicola]|uniref:Zinc finger, RanBP2-type n=1 Tax=Septoria linicola TaxID=215465 RepID=A0A9Q9AYQ1_9PEZI|nr:Putative Zinc finger, RanBP2-type [Septoria linicola]
MASWVCTGCLEKNPGAPAHCSSCEELTCSDCLLTNGGQWYSHRHGPLRQQYIQAFQRNLIAPELWSEQLSPPTNAQQIMELANDYWFGLRQRQGDGFAAHRRVCTDRGFAEAFGHEDDDYKWIAGGQWQTAMALIWYFADAENYAVVDEEASVPWEDEWYDDLDEDELQVMAAEMMGR